MINQIRIIRSEQQAYMGTMKLKDSVPNHIIDISTGNEIIVMDILK